MTQWFRGQLEGHYVGTSTGKAGVSQYGSAARYKLRIYRALIRNIEVLEHADEPEVDDSAADVPSKAPAPTAKPTARPPVELPDGCFYQAQIEDARLLDIRPHSCFEGPIYDVAVSDLEVTHSTKKGDKTYGRIVGEVYGRFLLPPEPEAVEVDRELTRTEADVAPGSEQALKNSNTEEGIEPLHPPVAPEETDSAAGGPVPFVLLIAVMATVLGIGSSASAALLWLGLLVPIFIIRLLLGGMIKVNNAQRAFGAVLIVVQVACLAVVMLEWWASGCKSVELLPLSGVIGAVLIAGVLPSVIPLLGTATGLALVLFVWFGGFGTHCEAPPVVQSPAAGPTAPPTVDDPGVPRTNDDGSWPRRPPGR